MAFPVSTTDSDLTGSFGPRTPIRLTNGGYSGGFHYGMDFAPEVRGTNAPVYSTKRGTVTGVGHRRDAGRYVIVFVPEWGVWLRYCHLSTYAVHAGQSVAEAQYLGRKGATGNVTGVHLHFEIYTDAALTKRVDPKPYIWYEKNPTDFAINGGTATSPKPSGSKPVTKPAPKPAPTNQVKVGSTLRLSRWTGYNTSALTGRQRELLNGDFKVVGISGGNFKVSGNRRTAWVSHLAAAGLVSGNAPKPVAKPKPKPAPKPAAPKRVVLGSTLRLRGWVGYSTADLKGRQGGLLNGDFRVTGIVGGNYKVVGNGREAWVSGKASAGLI
jgi:hypothetical protein